MNKKSVLLALLFMSFITSTAQYKKYYTNKSISKQRESNDIHGNLWYVMEEDSLLVGNKIYYFKTSPISFLDGFESIVCDEYLVLPFLSTGYTLQWETDKNKLYIHTISRNVGVCAGMQSDTTDTQKNKITLNDKEFIKQRLESFLGRRFDVGGLYADWVTGKFIVYKYIPNLYPYILKPNSKDYDIKLSKCQKVYILELRNGIVISFKRNKYLEKKYKEETIKNNKL